jgi:hypothetical protein
LGVRPRCRAPFFALPRPRDTAASGFYIEFMRTLIIVALFALLALAVWFAGAAWERFAGDNIPLYGYAAIVGGALISLLVGGGLMALVFYSSRHGYDDEANRFDK